MSIKKLGYNIMDVLEEQKMSVSELARRMSYGRTTVYHYINHPGRMTVDKFLMIADILGKTPAELLEGVWTDSEGMDGISRTFYICDPAKNKACKKTGCYFLHGGECFMTLHEEYADTEHEHTVGELAQKAWKIPEDREGEKWTD